MFQNRTKLRTLTYRMVILFAICEFLTDPLSGETKSSEVQVELRNTGHLSLHVKLRSGEQGESKFSRHLLPWASSDSMIIVASIAGGRCLTRELPVEDSSYLEIPPCLPILCLKVISI